MKDLFVFTADEDARQTISAILNRPKDLEIRPVVFDVERHVGRDPGIVKDGPEIVRIYKNQYSKTILIWDFQGCGKTNSNKCRNDSQKRLDRVTWKDNSGAILIVPELEEWLFYDIPSVAIGIESQIDEVNKWIGDYLARINKNRGKKKQVTREMVLKEKPKDIFNLLCVKKYTRQSRPNDFRRIAKKANLENWMGSTSFFAMVELLRAWFPQKK